MVQRIYLRIWSEYWPNKNWLKWRNKDYKDLSNYHFYKYIAQVRASKREEWGKELWGTDVRMYVFPTTPPFAVASKLSLESIVRQVFGKSYSGMMRPSYDILLWEGPHPFIKLKKRNVPEIVTTTPKDYVRDKLGMIFDEYYQFKSLVSQNQYEEAYEMVSKNQLGHTFIDSIDDKFLRKFYIGLRKQSKSKAIEIVRKYFPLDFYFELETAFLHDLERE